MEGMPNVALLKSLGRACVQDAIFLGDFGLGQLPRFDEKLGPWVFRGRGWPGGAKHDGKARNVPEHKNILPGRLIFPSGQDIKNANDKPSDLAGGRDERGDRGSE
jgi:hypothetical protein